MPLLVVVVYCLCIVYEMVLLYIVFDDQEATPHAQAQLIFGSLSHTLEKAKDDNFWFGRAEKNAKESFWMR